MTLDLVVLCPDAAWKQVLDVLLHKRHQSLGIREVRCRFVSDPLHDSSGQAVDLLRPFRSQASHAMVVRDLHGSGREAAGAEMLEENILADLEASGWSRECSAAIVADPEIEAWLRFDSKHVENLLLERARRNRDRIDEWRDRLREIVANRGGANELGKPRAPKEVFADLTKGIYGIPTSNEVLALLAGNESLKVCAEPSFQRFKDQMRAWFPSSSGHGGPRG